MSLLIPDFGLLFWMTISFAVVFVLLARFGFPVITRSVEKRSKYIRDSLDAADEANRRLESVQSEADRLTAEARHEHSVIVRDAIAERESIVREAHEKAATERERQLSAARRQIEIQRVKVLEGINEQVASMALEIAEKILRDQLEDPGRQHTLAVRMLEEMEGIERNREKL